MFCDGNGGVLYLHMCLQINNGLINFVQEGFLDKDKFDSLEPDECDMFSPSSVEGIVVSFSKKNVSASKIQLVGELDGVSKALTLIADSNKKDKLQKIYEEKNIKTLDISTKLFEYFEKDNVYFFLCSRLVQIARPRLVCPSPMFFVAAAALRY